MKSKVILALVSAALLFTYPIAGYAWSGGRGHHYRSAPRVVYNHHHGSGNAVPYLLGGLVVGGLLGAVLSQPSYASPAPAPVPAPAPSYAYPTPSYGGEEPPGEWVSVPGRWVGGKWVPAHNVWVPVNP